VAHELGWGRYLDVHTPAIGRLNADYLADAAIIELKILEEEGLEKAERQTKLAKLFSLSGGHTEEVNISFETIPPAVHREVQKIVSMPIQTAVKKASQQIRHSGEDLTRERDAGVLLIVNNGYSYLNAENFERLVVQRCMNDSKRISYAFCVTVDYHQGDFDAFVFCTTRCHRIHTETPWPEENALVSVFQAHFDGSMTQMMRDQINPKFWENQLAPVTDIRFEANGIRYVHKAPEVPDSRLREDGFSKPL
jgi:hypothetical protein